MGIMTVLPPDAAGRPHGRTMNFPNTQHQLVLHYQHILFLFLYFSISGGCILRRPVGQRGGLYNHSTKKKHQKTVHSNRGGLCD